MASKTYDVKCFELAQHFAQDHPGLKLEQINTLAWEIQHAIEEFFHDLDCRQMSETDQALRNARAMGQAFDAILGSAFPTLIKPKG